MPVILVVPYSDPSKPVPCCSLLTVIFLQALVALGLKSGGTVQQRAERLFLTKVSPCILSNKIWYKLICMKCISHLWMRKNFGCFL